MRKNYLWLFTGIGLVVAFLLWTWLVCCVDVQPIGPHHSTVGFAALNQWIHQRIGVHMTLYIITDWLGFVPLGIAFGFAILGLSQWIRRRRVVNVDHSILALGGFYILVMAVFLLFETMVINYRPVLIDGILEASYPSSTTLLALTILPTAMLQLQRRVKNLVLRRWLHFLMSACSAFMVIGRIFSGVHWFTDIVGGILLSAGLVSLYAFCTAKMDA